VSDREQSDEGGPIAEHVPQSLTDDDAPTEELARRQGISLLGGSVSWRTRTCGTPTRTSSGS
jgi:hypothetical protein